LWIVAVFVIVQRKTLAARHIARYNRGGPHWVEGKSTRRALEWEFVAFAAVIIGAIAVVGLRSLI
jgi:hypothetical protein